MTRLLAVVALVAAAVLVGTATPAGAATVVVANETQYRNALTTLSGNPSGPHTITLTADITLTAGGDPTYTGSQDLTIDGNGHTIDAGDTSRILNVTAAGTANVTVRELELTHGYSTEPGGAVRIHQQVLHIIDSTLHDNDAAWGGAAASAVDGGDTKGVIIATNSTITDNDATIAGGGLYAGGIALEHATVASNGSPGGANVFSSGNLDAFASVLADPEGSGNCAVAFAVHSTGYNWSTDASCALAGTGDTNSGADPQLGTLADNSGPTPTRYPAFTSPLVNTIPTASCSTTLTTDQRGVPRPVPTGGNCDIGAVERTPLGPDFTVGDEAEYRDALAEASADTTMPHTITLADDITLDDGTSPTYSGTQGLTVDGDGHTLDADHTSRALHNTSTSVPLALTEITVSKGNAAGADGGGVYSRGPLTISDSTFTGNTAKQGGGVSGLQAVTVTDSTFTGNTGTNFGGGVFSFGAVTVTRSTFSGNTGGTSGGQGGGIYGHSGVTVISSTLTGNTANGFGGGVSGGEHVAVVRNSTVIGNTATQRGGGVYGGGVALAHATVTGNSSPAGANVRSEGNLDTFGSVIADPQGGGANCDLHGATNSTGYNWASDGWCALGHSTDTQNGDARLGPVRDNGGTTPTMFPLWGSPLRDAIPTGSCSATLPADQRGITRPYPAGGNCDIGAVEAVYPPHAFTDVPAWVDSSVRWITSTVNDPPLMTGITATTFRPNDNITRAQFARLLYREAGAPDVSGLPPHGFTDVPPWVEDAVRWAKANNVMTGITPTLFKPDAPITRAQVARAKYRFAGEQDTTGFDPHPFTDVPAWVDQAVTWAAHHQLMTGITPTTFRPDDPITRGQVARLDERLGLNPDAWADPDTAPPTLPFRPQIG